MTLFSFLSLRQWLTLPYLVLVFSVASLIGALSYKTGSEAVDTVANHLLQETVARIGQAVDRHIVGSAAVLEAAFPNGMPAPPTVTADIDALRTRFWIATSLHIDPNNYVYYGNQAGQFLGLWRSSLKDGELRLKVSPDKHRLFYRYSGIRGELVDPAPEEKMFEPRERPWYKAGAGNDKATWTAIYIDFRNQELVATRARRVLDAEGAFAGVVATDISLKRLNEFVRGLRVSDNAVAFIIEADGNLIASSRSANIALRRDGSAARISGGQSEDPLQRAAYNQIAEALKDPEKITKPVTLRFTGDDGAPIELAYDRVRDDAGLDWIIVVAMPRSDFMQGVTASVVRAVIIGVLGSLLALAIGLGVLEWVSRDLRHLTKAAKDVGEGLLDTPLDIDRSDEIGVLANTFRKMRYQLQTDVLTGLENRAAIERSLASRIDAARRSSDARPFAVLFVDLDQFKRINDTFGHDVGDRYLVEVAGRLRASVRANDRVARYAGDEFVMLVEEVASREAALAIRSHVEAAIAKPSEVLPSDTALQTGGSVGVAWYPEDGLDVDQLLKVCDQNMYAYKAARTAPRL